MPTTTLPAVEETRVRLETLLRPVAPDLAEAERIYQDALASHYPFVQTVVERAARLSGKRLRPALLLLCARAAGNVNHQHHILAAVVEMIHTATLIHDDVLDESALRRHAATINNQWGNETAVLLGDYFFTHAFHLAATTESTLACRWIGEATNCVCEGEMLQVHNRGNLDVSEQAYFAIVEGKTAALTAVSCRLGAHFAGCDAATVTALETYGREVGVAFQIGDDVMDLLGNEHATGKTLGTDIQKQKLTLPLIRLLQQADPNTSQTLRQLVVESTTDQHARAKLARNLRDSDALDYALARARRSIENALDCLQALPDSEARATLQQLAQMVTRRAF